MDHYQKVESAPIPILRIPYYCTDDYDGEEFSKYPARHGFEMETIRKRIAGDITTTLSEWNSLCDTLQTWLYVGLLNEMLKFALRGYNQETFKLLFLTIREDGEVLINTAELPAILTVWADWYRTGPQRPSWRLQLNEAEKGGLKQYVFEKVKLALTLTKYCIDVVQPSQAYEIKLLQHVPVHVQELLLSITVLSEFMLCTLELARNQRMGIGVDMPVILYSPFMMQLWISTGRCPRQVSELSLTMTPAVLLFACQIPRSDSNTSHADCTARVCRHSQVHEPSYETRHHATCSGGQDCQFLAIDEEEVAIIFESGGFPVVRLKEYIGADGKLQYKFRVQDGRRCEYVAFSHVWTDGLGNPKANSLPICQLRALKQVLHDPAEADGCPDIWPSIPEGDLSIAFWIDSLCVPVRSQGLRRRALAGLAKTFSSARAVVVLDEGLRGTTWKTSLLENFMRIRLSKWMSRLWTLEEAIFARVEGLFVVFEGGIFRVTEEMGESVRNDSDDARDFLAQTLQANAFRPFRRILEMKNETNIGKITELGHLMPQRSLSKVGDEALIVSTILGLDTALVYDCPVEHRVHKVLEMQRHWPIHMLFNSAAHKSTVPGYRWAPVSFLEKGIDGFLIGGQSSRADDNTLGEMIIEKAVEDDPDDTQVPFEGGLLVDLPALRSRSVCLAWDNFLPFNGRKIFFVFDVMLEIWYMVALDERESSEMRLDVSSPAQESDTTYSEIALIFPQELDVAEENVAALVKVYAVKGGRKMYCSRYRGLGTIWRISTEVGLSLPVLRSEFEERRLTLKSFLNEALNGRRSMIEDTLKAQWNGEQIIGSALQTLHDLKGLVIPAASTTPGDGWRWCVG